MSHYHRNVRQAKRERNELQTTALLTGDSSAFTLAIESDVSLARTRKDYR